MALSTSTVWEVRPTVGNDTNGGAFVVGASGVDFSQQNAKNTSGSNISVTDVVATGVATITSATANFTADIVGNVVFLSGSGISTGWYQAVTFTNSTTIILDRSPGTGTGVTLNVGGALATIATAYANSALANTIWVKATGAYTATSTLLVTSVSSLPFNFIGYGTTRGDGGQVTWTTATNSVDLISVDCENVMFQNFIFTNTASSPATCFFGTLSGQAIYLRISNCLIQGPFTVGLALGYVSSVHFNAACLVMDFCEVTGCSSHGISISPPATFIGCYIHGNGGDGVHGTLIGSGRDNSGALRFDRCVVYNNTGNGIYNDAGGTSSDLAYIEMLNCAIVANAGDGIRMNGGSGAPNCQHILLVNNVIESSGGFGINNVSPDAIFVPVLLNNAFRANTSGDYTGGGLSAQPSDITLTAEPFTNPSGNDFTLNNTSGGGLLLQGAGFPSSMP